MRIKAKLLIPRKEIDEEGNEIDPREELVARLLEYKRYKSVLEEMRELEAARSVREGRGNTTKELQKIATKALVDIELESVTLFKLLKNFERLMQRYEDRENNQIVHKVYRYSFTIKDQQIYLLEKVKRGQRSSFEDIFGYCKNRVHAIVTFLALLELLNMQRIQVVEGLGVNNFWLTVPEEDTREDAEELDIEKTEEE